MSTRSIILVTGPGRFGSSDVTFRLYKHCDGYPSGNLPIIGAAIERAIKDNSSADVKNWNDGKPEPITAEQITGLIIGEATSHCGMGAHLEEQFEEPLKLEHVGNQWDVEYVYLVDLNTNTVSVFSGSFTNGIQYGVKQGTIDIQTEVDRYLPEYQATVKKRLKRAVEDFKKSGFTLTKAGKKIVPGKINKAKQSCKIDLIITRGEK